MDELPESGHAGRVAYEYFSRQIPNACYIICTLEGVVPTDGRHQPHAEELDEELRDEEAEENPSEYTGWFVQTCVSKIGPIIQNV